VSLTVCLAGSNLGPPVAGHLWMQLNWALGLAAVGCRVIWLETVRPGAVKGELGERAALLRGELEEFGLGASLALREPHAGFLDLDAAAEADLLLDLGYCTDAAVMRRFRQTALIDIDPGLTQWWLHEGFITLAPHDAYFTIGETIGTPEARVPDCGLTWHHTPPPVFLPAWPRTEAAADAPYTTVSSWWGPWVNVNGESYPNDKRAGFLDYLDLPARSPRPLELALALAPADRPIPDEEARIIDAARAEITGHGWRVREASSVSERARQYRDYIQASRGEFSCAKPSCIRDAVAWISDRTLCYLASGKPAIVQHTGRSRLLPDADGLFRFRTPDEAAAALEAVEADYDHHARAARRLAETRFDAAYVVRAVLARATA
jgi:hypothetical protein